MNLGEFRRLTEDLSDDTQIIFEAAANPFGNVWTALGIEETTLAFFGRELPAVMLQRDTENNPED